MTMSEIHLFLSKIALLCVMINNKQFKNNLVKMTEQGKVLKNKKALNFFPQTVIRSVVPAVCT